MATLDATDPINRSLVGFWPMTEAAGSLAVDLSRYRRNGVRSGVTPAVGKYGRGVRTNGSATSYVSIPNLTIPSATPLTITWAGLYQSSAIDGTGFGAGTSSASSPRLLVHWPFRDVIYWDYGNDTTGRLSTSATPFTNRWCVWSFVNDGVSRKEIWANGVRLATSGSTAALSTSFSGVWFGAGPNGNYTNTVGSLLAGRIHFRALAPTELVRLGQNPWAGVWREPGFYGQWAAPAPAPPAAPVSPGPVGSIDGWPGVILPGPQSQVLRQ